jgi:hypothetical protein
MLQEPDNPRWAKRLEERLLYRSVHCRKQDFQMKKNDAERAIRQLSGAWRDERGLPFPAGDPAVHYSFSDFTTWLDEKHYSHYLNFRSVMGPREDAEHWFDQEMRQTWRN